MNGQMMKDIRYLLNLTQKQLGDFLGVSQSAIAHMEKETIKILPENKEKVLQVLNEKGLSQEQLYVLSKLKKGDC